MPTNLSDLTTIVKQDHVLYLSHWFSYDVEILKRVLCTIVSSQFILTYFVTFETSGSPLEFKIMSPTSGIEKVKATNNEINA